MSFRSRANPDQRRRRVLLDETRNEEGSPIAPPKARRGRNYPDDALAGAQPRVTDFLPTSWRRLTPLFLTMALGDAAIIALSWFRADWAAALPGLPDQMLDATAPGSLAQLWLTLKCCLATILCLVIFAIRRRRLDDLRGAYQSWAWAALLASPLILFAATDVEELIVFGIQHIPGLPQLTPPRVYLWAVYGLLYGPLLVRLLIEIRRVRLAQGLLLGGTVLVLGGEVIPFVGMPQRLGEIIAAALPMVAVTTLCLALLVYGRYVKLDARGAFGNSGRRKRRKKRVTEEEAEDEPDSDDDADESRTTRIDAGSSSVPRPNSLGAAISAARSNDLDDRRSGPLAKANRAQNRR
jgi:hypothetical protein